VNNYAISILLILYSSININEKNYRFVSITTKTTPNIINNPA